MDQVRTEHINKIRSLVCEMERYIYLGKDTSKILRELYVMQTQLYYYDSCPQNNDN